MMAGGERGRRRTLASHGKAHLSPKSGRNGVETREQLTPKLTPGSKQTERCWRGGLMAAGELKLAVVLAVVFIDFYRQHSFGFQALRTIMHQISLTLMSSTSFGTLVILGTKHTKLSQNGRNPRPAGLPLCHFIVQLLGDGPEQDIKQRSSVQHKYNPLRLEGMNEVHSGPQSVTNYLTKTQSDLSSNTRPWINVTRQRRAETCQSQADRPR